MWLGIEWRVRFDVVAIAVNFPENELNKIRRKKCNDCLASQMLRESHHVIAADKLRLHLPKRAAKPEMTALKPVVALLILER